MKLVLRRDISGIGKRGDIVDVADGHARNHLVPSGSAIIASAGVATQAASMRRSRDLRDAKDRESAESVAQRLVPIVITIPGRAGREGRLFGSITPSDLVAAVEQQAGVELDRHKLLSHEPIRSLGSHEVRVRLHPEVEFTLSIEVVPG
ncbi:MAG: ribosomal protein [Acidimicrobiaceae bacterium]|nr:ribosomal protein [Acidimicrobiaceae bacterium]